MYPLLRVEKTGRGFPLVESGGWNGETRQGGREQPTNELLVW